MFLRKLLLKAAIAIAGVFVMPSISKADITIQVVEIDASGNPISGTAPGQSGNPLNFSASSTTSLNSGQSSTPNYSISNISTSITTLGNSNFISTSLNLSVTNFSSTDGLKITVGYSNLANSFPGTNAPFTNQPSDTNQTSSPSNFTITSSTSVSDPSTNSVLASTMSSSATASNTNSGSGSTTSNFANLTNPYSLTQTITAYLTPTSGSVTGVVTGGVDTLITPNGSVVPAPGGLALALIALPVIGLRRSLRRKAVQPAI